jgi:hypothetical protein
MKKREIIATLIEVSNELDNLGMFDEADALTKTAQFFGDMSNEPELNPDEFGVDYGFVQGDEYDQHQAIMEMMRKEDEEKRNTDESNHQAIMDMMREEDVLKARERRIRELSNTDHPTEEDLRELDNLLKNNVSSNPTQDESDFIKRLQDAGAQLPDDNDETNPFRGE